MYILMYVTNICIRRKVKKTLISLLNLKLQWPSHINKGSVPSISFRNVSLTVVAMQLDQ